MTWPDWLRNSEDGYGRSVKLTRNSSFHTFASLHFILSAFFLTGQLGRWRDTIFYVKLSVEKRSLCSGRDVVLSDAQAQVQVLAEFGLKIAIFGFSAANLKIRKQPYTLTSAANAPSSAALPAMSRFMPGMGMVIDWLQCPQRSSMQSRFLSAWMLIG